MSHVSPETPTRRPKTHPSQIVVANSGNASTWRNVSIHRPGRGTIASSAGNHRSAANGSAIPTPSAVNTANASKAGADIAYPIAVPMNGAVHGVAITVASRPLVKDPVQVPRRRPVSACPAAAATPLPSSYSPIRLRDMPNMTSAQTPTNTGSWNWNPHPTARPAPRRANTTPTIAQNATRTPAANTTPCQRTCAGRSPTCSTKPRAFTERTGSTHGITLSNRPPRNARSSA